MVFKGLVKDHKGLKLFLEDDHYVVEDFIHVLDLMKKNEGNWCQYCMYSIGVHNQQFTLKVKPPKVGKNLFYHEILKMQLLVHLKLEFEYLLVLL